ncbi:hypothetical protein UCREL1_3493 [Eutypa lata UCREL1]|uniref:Alpha beta hydrolase fold-1 protein n=1 Tax=Eutypa lata (strain UCR-EL1) TaxID=1287681 RepID=M7THR0_EUTLA|nr:hypothetical protein UCREL1_3493 [Eutypa lata UCREL1]
MPLPRFLSFGRDPFDPTHRFATSWLLPPAALFAIRALFSLYAFTTLFFNLGWGCTHASTVAVTGGNTTDTGAAVSSSSGSETDDVRCLKTKQSFSYFTVLTYWGVAFYLLVAAVHTATYAWRGVPLLNARRFPRPLHALHALFYTSVTTYPPLVTIVYWAVLYPTAYGDAGGFPDAYAAWSNASQHALNSLFALFEILVPRTEPAPLIHLWWLIVILALYLGLAYVTVATEGFYVYPFLDAAETAGGRKGVTAYIFGILAAVVVLFGVVWCLVWARRWLTEEKLGCKGKFAAGDEVARNPAAGEKPSRNLSHTDPEMGVWTGTETKITANLA